MNNISHLASQAVSYATHLKSQVTSKIKEGDQKIASMAKNPLAQSASNAINLIQAKMTSFKEGKLTSQPPAISNRISRLYTKGKEVVANFNAKSEIQPEKKTLIPSPNLFSKLGNVGKKSLSPQAEQNINRIVNSFDKEIANFDTNMAKEKGSQFKTLPLTLLSVQLDKFKELQKEWKGTSHETICAQKLTNMEEEYAKAKGKFEATERKPFFTPKPEIQSKKETITQTKSRGTSLFSKLAPKEEKSLSTAIEEKINRITTRFDEDVASFDVNMAKEKNSQFKSLPLTSLSINLGKFKELRSEWKDTANETDCEQRLAKMEKEYGEAERKFQATQPRRF